MAAIAPWTAETFSWGDYIVERMPRWLDDPDSEVLVAADGGVVTSEELLERAWDEHADPFTNAVRITVSTLRKRLGEPWVIATVTGVGYRIDTQPGARA